MIDYEHVKGRRGTFQVRVKLDGKVAGAIKLVNGGFAYFPKGSKQAGETFKSVRAVQRSIEGTNDHDNE